ncbi:SDR family NAD(P)-dependent oxidoreductase [Actinomadura craniellae]|uniref:SDR family NAD(P)-dependent oxidoreductase n=1 Tax=Actinomadura craniellae TaxID=2231787 RepID=A0A365H5H8_9ACTN|nr:NAD(P)H-binding protein [Actinomadura craniellae]RAY14256.1 SDR family NAD(P)-dependent oxidoreductase [Actinomadura craniellae]
MTNSPIAVLGGRGKTGRRVAARLGDLGRPVRAVSRSTPLRFDWDDQDTWAAVLDGAEAVYLVPPTEHLDMSVVGTFTARAAAAGVRRLVSLSYRGADHAGEPPEERAVRESGIDWTILRPAWFDQNFSEDIFLEPVRAGRLEFPAGEGREAFVDADDIADVAVAALTGPGHAGEIYEISGPEPISLRTAASLIGRETGREITYTPIEPADFTAAMTAQGYPSEVAAMVTGLLGAIAGGAGDHVSDGVQRALGREPRSFADYAKATAATGVWG